MNSRNAGFTEDGDAVIIRNAKKSYYKRQPVLRGLNMTVSSGSIYGVCGKSGCGKSSLVKLIVGIGKVDRGDIWVFGETPGTKSIGIPGRNVGYMPQDISLYPEFTIAETLNYFGTLIGMSNEEITEARDYFCTFLDLPEDFRQIASLSGGQQRRVSLVTALLSGPKLLILDEPTVGVDPLIRFKIWEHLKLLVKSKRTTIIITTHYIEECKNVDTVGIMRNGKLLKESCPKLLMEEHCLPNLEKVILRLFREDNSSEESISLVNSNNIKPEKSLEPLPLEIARIIHEPKVGMWDSMIRIRALTEKQFVVLKRNILMLYMVLLLGGVQLILVCIALGQDPKNLAVGVVNGETNFTVCPPIRNRLEGECLVELLSCHYLKELKPDLLNLKQFESKEKAVAAVQCGAIWGYLEFPVNFTSSFYERINLNVDEVTFNNSEITVKLDESSKQIALAIKWELFKGFKMFVSKMLRECGYDPRQGDLSLKFNDPLFGTEGTDFREYLAPGAAIVVMFFFAIMPTAIPIIKERKTGIYQRSLVSGVKTWEILVATCIGQFFILFCQSILKYFLLKYLFGIKFIGSEVLVVIMFLLAGYGGVSFGFLLGSVCMEELQAAIIAIAAFFPNIVVSGIIWPQEGMTNALKSVASALPCTLASESVRSIISRGWHFFHPNVWPGFVIMFSYIIIILILTVIYHKVFKNNSS